MNLLKENIIISNELRSRLLERNSYLPCFLLTKRLSLSLTLLAKTKPILILSAFIAAAVASLLILYALWYSFINPVPSSPGATATRGCATPTTDSQDTTFYDDPSLSYAFGSR